MNCVNPLLNFDRTTGDTIKFHIFRKKIITGCDRNMKWFTQYYLINIKWSPTQPATQCIAGTDTLMKCLRRVGGLFCFC